MSLTNHDTYSSKDAAYDYHTGKVAKKADQGEVWPYDRLYFKAVEEKENAERTKVVMEQKYGKEVEKLEAEVESLQAYKEMYEKEVEKRKQLEKENLNLQAKCKQLEHENLKLQTKVMSPMTPPLTGNSSGYMRATSMGSDHSNTSSSPKTPGGGSRTSFSSKSHNGGTSSSLSPLLSNSSIYGAGGIANMHTSQKPISELKNAFFSSEKLIGPLRGHHGPQSNISYNRSILAMCTSVDNFVFIYDGGNPVVQHDAKCRVVNVKVTPTGEIFYMLGSKGVVRIGGGREEAVQTGVPHGVYVIDMDVSENGIVYVLCERRLYICSRGTVCSEIPLEHGETGIAVNVAENTCAFTTYNDRTNLRTLYYFSTTVKSELKMCHIPKAANGGRFMIYRAAAYICCRSTKVIRIDLTTNDVHTLPLFDRLHDFDFIDIAYNRSKNTIAVRASKGTGTNYTYEIIPYKLTGL